MRKLLQIITLLLPWKLRRWALNRWLGYDIAPTASIGLAWVFPKKLIMRAGARIDHFTIAIHLDAIVMEEKSKIGRSNWITGFTTGNDVPKFFKHQPQRKAELRMGRHSAITKHHHIDCTNLIDIGQFSTIAGYYSQLLTHSIDIVESRQDSAPIYIGDYTFVGTNVVILGGASLPSYSVLGAKSLLNKQYTEEWMLYGGVPAKAIQHLSKDTKYFSRREGYVY